jgi:ribokinase
MARAARIAVVGSANTDLITVCDTFPRTGETVFGRHFQLGFGGKGANQAVAARLCGADVSMIARVGSDLFGEATLRNFASFGIDTRHVRSLPEAMTGVAPIFVDPAGQNRIIVIKGANDRLMPEDVDAAGDVLGSVDVMILQFEIPLPTIYHAVRFARAHRIRCIVNPAPALPADLDALAAADYFIPNETEAEALTGHSVQTLEDARACAASLLRRGFTRVVLTLGARGALLAEAGESVHVPPFDVPTVDSTGAGDAFIGSLAVFLAEGMSARDAVTRANLYAALSTMQMGAQKAFPTRTQLEMEWSRRGVLAV